MKKSTGSILLLSAFAALVLAGCGNDTNASSATTGSSDTAVQTSADETSTPAGTSESATGTSAAGTSTTTSSASSSAAASSSSSAAASSSTPAVETDWSNKTFIGEYKGGMNNLIINADKTTSWGTSTDKFPATYTELSTGVWMIKSTAAVADEDYVEVITDGTMAYVMHDKEAYDYYVMDKNALGSAVIAFAETADEETFFGGIEVTAGHWKYFACIGGTYTFGATITMQAGTNINAGGAIFDFGTGANKTSWKVYQAAAAATSFAKIEQTNFTATTYTGDHGDLVIGTDNDGLVFAKLNGVALDGAQLSSDGNVLSVPNGSTATGVDTTDPAGPMMVVPTTTYTLAKIALTYTQGEGTMKTPLFDTISGANGTYTQATDNSGNVWVVYVASESGILEVTETAGEVADSYLSVYDSTAPEYTASYSSSYALAENDNGTNTGVHVQVTVIAGHAYVIKLGSYYSRGTNYNGTSASYADQEEEFEWIFTAFTHDVYTGDAGELDLLMSGPDLVSITLAGNQITDFTKNGNTITTVNKTTDLTDPSDIFITTTTSTFTIDPATHTYTSADAPVETRPFHALTETSTGYSGDTSEDGNIWCSFTPTKAGMITVGGEITGYSYSTYAYLSVYKFDPATGLAGLATSGAQRVGYDYDYEAETVVSVQAGVTYIIKLGFSSTTSNTIGDTASTSYIGVSGEITFAYVDYVIETFTGAEGDLVIATKEGNYMSATLDGTPIAGKATYDATNGVYSVIGTQTLDMTDPEDPILNSTDDVYTLDLVNKTYTKVSQAGVYHVLNVLTESSTGLSGYIGEDGSIWASFTPSADGLISIDETIQASSGSAHDTLVAVYEKTGTSTWADYVNYSSSGGTNGQKALNAVAPYQSGADNGTSPVFVHDLPVQAGHTYIIKIGVYWANSVTLGGQISSSYTGYVGSMEAFEFSFAAFATNTYTADGADDLTITTVGGELYSAKLGTTELTTASLSEDGKTLTVLGANPIMNTSNPLDPVATYTNTVYYLDNEGLVYETDTEVSEKHLFQTIEATDTSFTGTVGKDGNLWGMFTAPEDGVITVEETTSTSTDGYIAVYESTASSFTSTNALRTADSGASLSGAGKISNLPVTKGKTYIIKAGNYYDKDKLIGGSGTSTYNGKTETVSFTYIGSTFTTYTGDEGDLVLKHFGTTFQGATLNGVALNATPNEDQTVFTATGGQFNGEGTFESITKTYTLGEGTYETETSTEATQVTLSDTWTGANTGAYATLANGSIIIAFTPETTGTYTFTLDALAGNDTKLGVYAANFNGTGFAGNPLVNSDKGSGQAETCTLECTAGTTYYIKASAYWSDFNKAITSMNAQASRVGVDLTLTVSL